MERRQSQPVAESLPLLEKYKFNAARRAERLHLMGLSEADKALTLQLNEQVIKPAAEQIIEDFYSFLLSHSQMYQYLPQNILGRLRKTQLEYLLSFGIDFDQPYYFEYRLRIGVAHERVGLTLDLYQAAYRQMASLIISAMPEQIKESTNRELCSIYTDLILKITMLDMSLATDTYISASLGTMAESIRDLTDQQQSLIIEVQHDALTGVYSRRYLLEYLDKLIISAKRYSDRQFCIAMLDMDHFKKINDQKGHLVGDKLLRHVAGLMQEATRQADLVGRYGGEEFMIIFTDTSLEKAEQVADRIRQYIASHPMQLENEQFNVTASLGLTQFQSYDTSESLIQRADQALYFAKNSGRNCVKVI